MMDATGRDRAARARRQDPMPAVGETLRREREKRGESLEAVAKATRINVRLLTALEAGRYEQLPGRVYTKGFVAAYARHLGLDPEPLIRSYLAEEEALARSGRLDAPADVVEQLRQTVGRRRSPRKAGSRWRRVAFPAAALLALILVAGLWGRTGQDWGFARGKREPAAPSAAAGAPEEASVPGGEPEPMAADTAPSGTAGKSSAAAAPQPPPKVEGQAAPPRRPREEAREAGSGARKESARAPVEVPRDAGGQAHPGTAARGGPADEGPRLSVRDFGVGTAVVARQLKGASDRFAGGTTVYFWTRVLGGRPGDAVDHVWFHEGRLVGRVRLPIGGPHWRTYSRRTLPRNCRGSWTVEARDAAGRVLARSAFRCEPSGG
ncbi:MAG: DUF2914 domain-containing protein [Acidobacteria bacterium]|nr:MAG: DUF2914 domain-containing protein [Acidobacteriota bacterium]